MAGEFWEARSNYEELEKNWVVEFLIHYPMSQAK